MQAELHDMRWDWRAGMRIMRCDAMVRHGMEWNGEAGGALEGCVWMRDMRAYMLCQG